MHGFLFFIALYSQLYITFCSKAITIIDCGFYYYLLLSIIVNCLRGGVKFSFQDNIKIVSIYDDQSIGVLY